MHQYNYDDPYNYGALSQKKYQMPSSQASMPKYFIAISAFTLLFALGFLAYLVTNTSEDENTPVPKPTLEPSMY